jgi:hypothetical protein
MLEIDVGELLAVVVADDEAGGLLLDGPRRREVACGHVRHARYRDPAVAQRLANCRTPYLIDALNLIFKIPHYQMRVISFHSVPILFSHSLNDGRSTSSNSGQPEIDCGDNHGCCMVSGIISRILALLKSIVG